jgi:sigma-70-like protein
MSRLDDLPPDQRAAVLLLVRRRKSYAEVAALLQIQERAVRDRVHAGLAALAGGTALDIRAGELTPERREEIGDYLLGQQGNVGERLRTRTLLESSATARAWARAISTELAPISGAPLAEIPAGPDSQAAAREHPGAYPARSSRQLPSSRLGGALLLAAIVAGVVIAVVALSGSGSKKRTGPGAAGTSTTNASHATEDKRITLIPTDSTSKAIGVAEVLSEGSKYAFYLAAEHLAPSKGFFYAVWLYNSPTSYEALSRSPPVASDGRLQGGALLPANAANYHQMLLTRETSERPSKPGTVVLSGAFALH